MSASLEITALIKRFGGLTATDNVSFTVNAGQSVGLIGPNGAGKTTIFSQIMGELRQDSGAIILGGVELSSYSTPKRIEQGVSRTYQVPRPFSELSVAENIRIGLTPNSLWKMITESTDTQRELELALSVGFSEADLRRLPGELSMGELRKLEMARTMATEPRVMLLDEVFAGLTATEISQISSLIQEMRNNGMTFLIVSHDLKALEPLVDSAIAINNGSIVASGNFTDVLSADAVRASYLGTI